MMDADKSAWMRWVTDYSLHRAQYFTCDAQVTLEKAITYGMNPEHTVVFPWGVDLEHFQPKKEERGKQNTTGTNRQR
jgi:hypothetical protein